MDIRFQFITPRKHRTRRKSKSPSSKKDLRFSPMQQKGFAYEEHAMAFLCAQGLELLERNLRCKLGELDLVMRDKETLVFVEVRFRHSPQFGSAMDSITPNKQYKLRKTAQYFLPFLATKHFHARLPFCRFDALCLQADDHQPIWLKNI